MILHIQNAIDAGTLDAVIESLEQEFFSDGRDTAGRAAKIVKNNQQLRLNNNTPAGLQMLLNHLQQQPALHKAAFPQQFVNVMLNRYQPAMQYGTHVDDALMGSVRTDISFTLGLSADNDYQGGELILEDSTGERAWKLNRGELLLYPSHYLHRVNPVESGVRLAMVGWIKSHVRDSQQRELLFDLNSSMSEELDQRGKTEQYDRLSKTYNNLLRRWAE